MIIVRILFEKIRGALRAISPNEWGVIVLILLCAGGFISYSLITGEVDQVQAQSMADIRNRDILRVGVRDDVQKFCIYKQDEGYVGMEADIARALAKRILGDQSKVEFVKVDYTTRTSKLSEDFVDCVIALSEQGYNSDMLYSHPYYTDAVGIVTKKGDITSVDGLKRKRVGAVQRPPESSIKQGALDVLSAFGTNGPMFMTVVKYSSAPDMADDLRNGKIAGFAMEGALISHYFTDVLQPLGDAIGTVAYSVVIPQDNPALQLLADEVLSDMKKTGALQSLWQKWELVDYSDK